MSYRHILAAVNLLPAPIINTKPSTVSQWLIQIGLHQLYHLFTCKGYNTINDVCHLRELQLSAVLQIQQLGYRKRIDYSLSQIRAATPERSFAPSNPDLSSPVYISSSPSDRAFPMKPFSASNVPPPPPRHDSYAVTQQFLSQYDRYSTNSYPRDASRVTGRRSGSVPQEEHYSQPNPLPNNPPPLPPKNPTADPSAKKKPMLLPKPVLTNNIMLKNSSSFTVTPLRPERLGHTGERQVAQSKNSFSQIGVQLKYTVDLMSENSKQTLISYLSQSLQPRDLAPSNSNDNSSIPAVHQVSSKGNAYSKIKLNQRKTDKPPLESPEFITSPIYQQRIEETGESMPPEAPKRKDRRYHSMMSHFRDPQIVSAPTDESIASYYVEGVAKGNTDQKKNRFGKFRSSKKIVKQNPVYESSDVLQVTRLYCKFVLIFSPNSILNLAIFGIK